MSPEPKLYQRHISMATSAVLTVSVLAHSPEEAELLIARNAKRGDYDAEAQNISDQSGGFNLEQTWAEYEDADGVDPTTVGHDADEYEPFNAETDL